MYPNSRGLQLDFDTADRITILNLKDCYKTLIKENEEIQALDEIPEHKSQDLVYNINMLKHISAVLHYFGETV